MSFSAQDSSMKAVNSFFASKFPSMAFTFTATREKEPIISRQHTIIHTAAKDIKPWVKMLLKPSAMK